MAICVAQLLPIHAIDSKNQIPKGFALQQREQFAEDTNRARYGLVYGLYYYAQSPFQDLTNIDPKSDWKAYPIVSADDKPAMVPIPGLMFNYYFVVNAECAHPEAVIKMHNLATEKLFGKTADPDKYSSDPVCVDGSKKAEL